MLSKLKRALSNCLHIQKNMMYVNKMELLQNRILYSNESLTNLNNKCIVPITISLTSYDRRIYDVPFVIESIGMQTYKANRIILWLDKNEFNFNLLPIQIKKLIDRGLDVRFCDNLKSYKKIIPTLQLDTDSHIITIDDDVAYPVDFIERFLLAHLHHPSVILCNRAHKIKIKKGIIDKYKNWDLCTEDTDASPLIFPTGVGGVFYPRGCFDSEVCNIESFMKLAPNADDVWFKAMTLKNGFISKLANEKKYFDDEFYVIQKNQEIGLYRTNLFANQNDIQIKSVFESYSLWDKLKNKY